MRLGVLPIYMGFLAYLHWYMYRKNDNISQIWAPCPNIDTKNLKLVKNGTAYYGYVNYGTKILK